MTAEITNTLVAQLRSSVRGLFLDANEMTELYYRNHRSNGQKNLRCFPRCSDTHVEHGFCGRPIRVLIFIPIGIIKLEDLLVIGEFRAVNEVSPTGVNKNCVIGEGGILESVLVPRMRCKDQPMNQYYTSRETSRTKQEGYWEVYVEFAVEYCSWHYGWKGGRFKQHIRHEFMVTVLTRQFQAVSPTRSKNLENLGQFSSPTFHINSLRRKSKRKGQELGKIIDDEDSEMSTSILPCDSNHPMISTSNDMMPVSEKRSCYVQVNNITGEERANILAQAAAELEEEFDSDDDSDESTDIPSCMSQGGCTMTTLDTSSSLPVYSSYIVFGQSPEQTLRGPPIGPLIDVDFVKSLLELQDAFLRQQIQPSGTDPNLKPENNDGDNPLHFIKKGSKQSKKKQASVLATGFLEASPLSDKTSSLSSYTFLASGDDSDDADGSHHSATTFSTGN